MPIHDWTRVDAGLFHDFHQDWTIELCRALNAGRLPPGFTALTDQQTREPIPDVITLHRKPGSPARQQGGACVAIATAPPQARFIDEAEEDTYARRANRIRIQHQHGQVVAIIEIVSPGNKNSRTALKAFVRKAADLIWQGIHLLIVDLFPPSERDPQVPATRCMTPQEPAKPGNARLIPEAHGGDDDCETRRGAARPGVIRTDKDGPWKWALGG